jgi:type 1 glutamine amidotransferase
MHRAFALLLMTAALAAAQPKRVLYFTFSAGFRHDSIPLSEQLLGEAAARTGALEVIASQDPGLLTAEGLRDFDALFFFTSGELPLDDSQKSALLDFVRSGKGFGGVHSATDTFYTWPEYGDLIGARFDGHPWAQEINVHVEDPDHPAMRGLAPSFRITDEIYQFREISRERVRVLMTLDVDSVDLNREGVNRDDGDFALAWCHNYGGGRVFYTALGHLDETWRDERFQQMLTGALLWLTGQADADATPLPVPLPLPPLVPQPVFPSPK